MKTFGCFIGNTLKVLLILVVVYFIGSMIYITFHRADLAEEPVSAFFKTLGFWGICFIVLIGNFFFVGLTNIKKGGPIYALLVLDVVVCWIIYGLLF